MSFTPREIVAELDRYIVGQSDAKKAVAIALRNRWRRQQIPSPLKEEISPKNIILMGPTGCGKTEIARRLAKLAQAPFVKVEATKFTEVGYVGRDVDSMIRDLVEVAVKMCKEEALKIVNEKAKVQAEERVLDLLTHTSGGHVGPRLNIEEEHSASEKESREKLRQSLRAGELDDRQVEIELKQSMPGMPMVQMMGPVAGFDEMASSIQDSLEKAFGGNRKKQRKIKVKEALEVLAQEEGQKLVDLDQVHQDAVTKAEQSGIVFIDEIDKVASKESRGQDVSREGVQRDILPIVEGSAVSTKYGIVRTDHILFIAAGAFHVSKPSDLIPELQGRFPIRVELNSLTEEDFMQILTEPENSLVKQYSALLGTEQTTLQFATDGLRAIAQIATQVNASQQNIGARRLYTIMEKLFEEDSFSSPDRPASTLAVDAALVRTRLGKILENEDLSRFIL
ncbi:MAG: ATP-dependent protease ATPase subunit HslU [Myxococcota bacterium]